MEFDAFLSHNSLDKPQIEVIATALKDKGIKVWFDKWELVPGLPWLPALEVGLQQSKVVVVLVGPGGVGRWEEPEISVALDESMHRNIPVIPVLLPGGLKVNLENRPFLRQYTWVEFKDSLHDSEAMERLIWGITGRNPHLERTIAPLPQAPAKKLDPVSQAIEYLTERSQLTNITFILGKNYFDVGADNSMPGQISRKLLTSLNLIGSDYDHLIPPLDLSAGYYVARWDESQLESQMTELLMPQKAQIPEIYTALARLLGILRDRPARRLRNPVEQLVMTTNIDTWLERALLSAGISFSRVVQFRSRPRLIVNQYQNVSVPDRGLIRVDSAHSGSVTADINNLDEIDDIIRRQQEQIFDMGDIGSGAEPASALSISKLQRPIVYKLLGSHDIMGSCAISADQYYDLAMQVSRFNSIPPKIREIITNSPVVFLGCGILDSDFRISYFTLLRDAFSIKGHKRHALCASMDIDPHDVAQKMSLDSWESLRNTALSAYGIDLLDAGIRPFLDSLCESIVATRSIAR